MTKQRFILFDFDGVIADSFAITHATLLAKCPGITEEMHRKGFEGNIHDWDWRGLAVHTPECQHDLNWDEIYTPKFKKQVRPFTGALEIIPKLAAEYRLLIITSTKTLLVREFLETYRAATYFNEIMGNDIHTHKVEKMRMIFEKYQVGAQDCVFITDTLGDMREAKEHGMGTIGCSWGFHTHATLEKGIPFRIVDTPAELPDAVADYFAV